MYVHCIACLPYIDRQQVASSSDRVERVVVGLYAQPWLAQPAAGTNAEQCRAAAEQSRTQQSSRAAHSRTQHNTAEQSCWHQRPLTPLLHFHQQRRLGLVCSIAHSISRRVLHSTSHMQRACAHSSACMCTLYIACSCSLKFHPHLTQFIAFSTIKCQRSSYPMRYAT